MAITRYLSAASLGLLVTTTLLYLMRLLIDVGADAVTESKQRASLSWISREMEERIIEDAVKPTRLQNPAPVPTDPRRVDGGDGVVAALPTALPVVPGIPLDYLQPGMLDGPLMNIIKVAPRYPVRAALKGMSGFVTVRYDVSANGTVSSVLVVESSHSLFEAAAIEAAYRFRYKPKIVNGIAEESYGLLHRFVFQMED
jgi:protein TonB